MRRACRPARTRDTARYLPEIGEGDDGRTASNRGNIAARSCRAKTTLGDYHFQMSNKTLRKPATGSRQRCQQRQLGDLRLSRRICPPISRDRQAAGDVEKHGDDVAKRRMEEQAAAHLQISGTSTCRAFSTGYYFSLLGKDEQPKKVPGTEGKYVLTSLKHSIQQDPEYISGGAIQPALSQHIHLHSTGRFPTGRRASTPRPVGAGHANRGRRSA